MRRIMLVVAYDGTKYCGWQVQPNGLTIEEVLNKNLSELLGETIEVTGASRTDSGVHAYGNVAVFDTEARIPADKICFALNQRLPEDIVVQESREVARSFHPRHCDSVKTYEYRIMNSVHPHPLQRFYMHFVHRPLDTGAMEKAAGYLTGTHDFRSFCSVHTQAKETVRTIYSAEIITEDLPSDENGKTIIIRISGNGFLYNMVRIIAGTLIQIGHHQMEPEEMEKMIEAANRAAAGPTAPAKGLTLVSIDFVKGTC